MDQTRSLVDQMSSSEVKIALFRALFRGRDDVYPRRIESRKTNRRFLPVSDDVIRWHLSGCDDAGESFVAGVYPMLLDETCFFLAVDFDKGDWLEDSTAFIETCNRLNVPAVLERSRSGRGGHVWLLFEEAVPAALARKVGSYILTETIRGSSLRLMDRSTLRIRSRTGVIDARTNSSRRTAISCCAISPRTLLRSWMLCSMGFCDR